MPQDSIPNPPPGPSTSWLPQAVVDNPIIAAIASGVALAVLGFLVGLYSSILTERALREADERYRNQLQDVYKDAINRVIEQSKAFADLKEAVGKAQGSAEAASKDAQDAAKSASVAATAATNAAAAATSASDTSTQRLSQITGPVLDQLADLLANSKSAQIKLSVGADKGVGELRQSINDIAAALQWKEVEGTAPFRAGCEYRLHAKSWLFEIGNKTGAPEFDLIATKISTENITALFLGGPIDPTHIPLTIKKDTKTIATEIGGPGSGATRSVVVLERCPPTMR